jgi:hypothetical protein
MPIIEEKKEIIKEIGATELDFTPLENRMKRIEGQQIVIMVALAVILLLLLKKK